MNTDVSSLKIDPFVIGSADGVVRTNMYFRTTWSGYFQFAVRVTEFGSALAGSAANVTV